MAIAGLPWPLPPMLLTMQQGPPQDLPGYLYEVKWDGLRTLALVQDGAVRLISRSGRDRTAIFPELQRLAQLTRGQPVLLDAELVVVHAGRFHFGRALTRDRMSGTRQVTQAAQATPATLMVFDLLAEGDTNWCERGLAERRQRLLQLLIPDPMVQPTEVFPSGRDLYQATAQAGMEGVVGKALDSRYVPGVRSPHWHKHKHRRVQDSVVVGCSPATGVPTALHLAAYDEEDQLVYIGKVGSGLTAADALQVASALSPVPAPLCLGVPRGDSRWVVPALTARVAFAEWTDHLHLRQPSLVGWSTLAPAACRLP